MKIAFVKYLHHFTVIYPPRQMQTLNFKMLRYLVNICKNPKLQFTNQRIMVSALPSSSSADKEIILTRFIKQKIKECRYYRSGGGNIFLRSIYFFALQWLYCSTLVSGSVNKGQGWGTPCQADVRKDANLQT